MNITEGDGVRASPCPMSSVYVIESSFGLQQQQQFSVTVHYYAYIYIYIDLYIYLNCYKCSQSGVTVCKKKLWM